MAKTKPLNLTIVPSLHGKQWSDKFIVILTLTEQRNLSYQSVLSAHLIHALCVFLSTHTETTKFD